MIVFNIFSMLFEYFAKSLDNKCMVVFNFVFFSSFSSWNFSLILELSLHLWNLNRISNICCSMSFQKIFNKAFSQGIFHVRTKGEFGSFTDCILLYSLLSYQVCFSLVRCIFLVTVNLKPTGRKVYRKNSIFSGKYVKNIDLRHRQTS